MDPATAMAAIVEWAEAEDNIRAVVVTGSVARGGDEVDEFSDLDIELYAVEPRPLLEDDDWYQPFGDVLVVEALPNPGRLPTRLIYYADGKVDFTIGSTADVSAFRRDRPFLVLVDKDGLARELQVRRSDTAPTAEEFLECLHWFYAAALMEAKLLARRDLWLAKFREWDLLRELLRMLEWDHKARYGWDYDTWHNGKKIAEWADDDIRAEAERCWATYDDRDMAAALDRAVRLFARLAGRVGSALSTEAFDHGKVRASLARLLAFHD